MRLKIELSMDSLTARMGSLKTFLANMALITAGSCIFAMGLNGVLIPQQFLSGGLTGLALIAHYLLEDLNVGLTYFVLNIPLLLLGWFYVSKRFAVYSVLGIVVFSVAAGTLRVSPPPLQDPMLAALLAGVVCGAGSGIILRSSGSAGGMDILAIYLNQRWGFRPGSTIFASNALILVGGAFLFQLEPALYSVVYMYTAGKLTDAVITGFNQRKSVLIVSDESRAIAREILARTDRGVTFLKGCGAYTQRDKEVIFTITALTELPRLKAMVYRIDPEAFMVINDTLEVLGKRHGTRKVY